MAKDKAGKAFFATLWTRLFGKVDPQGGSAIIEEHRDILDAV